MAQHPENEIENKNSSSTIQLSKYRQLFWDSLPRPLSWTNDYAYLFSTAQRNYLDSVIADFEKETTIEICIVTLDSFCCSKENFEDLAFHISNTWKVGKKEKNNGIVICLSPGYRKIRINNGNGIEKLLSDEETKNIIEFYFLPAYKRAHFFEGTVEGLNAIIEKLKR
jgi:uncharacterized protein